MTHPPNSIKAEATSSEELLARARNGDATALTELYYTHAGALFTLAYRLTKSREEAEDIVHDLFVGLPEALRKYEERGSAGAWLKRIAARLALTRLRTLKRFPEIDVQQLTDTFTTSSEQISIEGIGLAQAIDSLPEPLRRVFLLKEVEGFSHAEIAGLLGISVSASQVRFHRAVRALRRALTPTPERR